MLTRAYKEAGVPLKQAFGIPYPVYFTNPVVEYNALVNAAGIIDLTHWKVFRATGADRVKFLNAMLTNDIDALAPNHGCHSTITTTKGKIIASLFVLAMGDSVLVFVPQGDAGDALEVLRKHIVSEDVTIDDISSSYEVIGIEGPKAYDCLWRMFPTGPFPKEPFTAVERQFDTVDLLVMRNTVTGDQGYHIMIPTKEFGRIRNYLVQASRGSDGLPIGQIAWNIRRTENGLPWYGIDFSADNFPHEARLENTISYSKGCFRGQETLARLKYRGHVNRLLVGMTVENDLSKDIGNLWSQLDTEVSLFEEAFVREKAKPIVEALDLSRQFPFECPLYAGGKDRKSVGWVTSSVYSPKLQKPLLMGYVRHEIVEAGKKMRMEQTGSKMPVMMVDLPVTPPDGDPR